jgi:YVTN family beta-propeller protein
MKRAPRPSLLFWLAAATAAAAFGCGLNQEGVQPLPDLIGYPASAVMDSSGEWLFVANSNADLRYNDGTLIAMRVARAAEDRRNRGVTIDGTFVPAETCPSVGYVRPRSESPDFCCIDPLDPYVINCDERRYIESGATVRIGSFAAGMLRQDPPCKVNPDSGCALCEGTVDTGTSRLLIAVRGDTSLTYVDVTPEGTKPDGSFQPLVFDCVGNSTDHMNGDDGHAPFAACDNDHRVIETESALALATDDAEPPVVRFPDEPYALALDQDSGLLYVGHLSGITTRPGSGGVSLFDVAAVNDSLPPPRLIATFANIFSPNANGQMGVTSLRWEPGRAVFATSRFVPLVTGLAATTPLGCPRRSDTEPVREIALYGNGETFGTTLTGSETRGIQFVRSTVGADTVEHAFVLQRVPPAVVDFYQGVPNQVLEVCQSPTFLQKNNAGDRLFVTCFDSGEVYVIDPFTPQVERIFTVGRGPAGLVFPEHDSTVAYVVGFSDNNISVVDIEPGSPTQYHVVQRIGFPNSVPR